MNFLKSIKYEIIKTNNKKSFGKDTLYLFGSRTDDTKRGGDIDLAVDSNLSRLEFRQKKIKFFTMLTKIDFNYKVDLVNFNTNDILLHQEIQINHIKL